MKFKLLLVPILVAFGFFYAVSGVSASQSYLAEYWDTAAVPTPSMPVGAATVTTTVSEVNIDWGAGSPDGIGSDGFIARYTTTIGAGDYVFRLGSDDGTRVYIDSTMILDNWIEQSYTTTSTIYTVPSGTHTLKIEYYENAGVAKINFSFNQNFAGGLGTAESPYQISTCQELQNINAGDGDYLDKYFELTGNIDCTTDTRAGGALYDNGAGFTPIGVDAKRFSGDFDGNGYTISGLYINRTLTNYTGLFGYVTGSVHDVNMADVDVTGTYFVGGLVARLNSPGTMTNTRVTGSVSGIQYVGGLLGFLGASISSSSASTTVVIPAGSSAGGLVGALICEISSCSISNSSSTGTVDGPDYTGGLVGQLSAGTTTDSWSSSSVSGGSETGGLVGFANNSNILNSYAIGDVTASISNTGGLVGYAYISNIRTSYASGDVTATGDDVGGLIGLARDSIISNTYATGNVTATNRYSAGGLVGEETTVVPASITNSYATGDVTGKGNVGGLVGANNANEIINTFAVGSLTSIDSYIGGITGYDSTDPRDLTLYSNNHWFNSTNAGVGGVAVSSLYDSNWKKVSTSSVFQGDYSVNPFKTGATQNWDTSIWAFPEGQYPQLQAFFGAWEPTCHTIANAATYNAYPTCGVATCNSGYTLTDGVCVVEQCDTVENATTYNSYPTCGPATCSSGYTLSNGTCVVVRNSGGAALVLPAGIGTGDSDSSAIGIGATLQVGSIDQSGTNVLTYISNTNNFSAPESSNGWNLGAHNFIITDLDLASQIATITFNSEPVIITLKKGESHNIDLDGDKIADIRATFTNTFVNRAEITVKSLAKTPSATSTPVVNFSQTSDVVVNNSASKITFLNNIATNYQQGSKLKFDYRYPNEGVKSISVRVTRQLIDTNGKVVKTLTVSKLIKPGIAFIGYVNENLAKNLVPGNYTINVIIKDKAGNTLDQNGFAITVEKIKKNYFILNSEMPAATAIAFDQKVWAKVKSDVLLPANPRFKFSYTNTTGVRHTVRMVRELIGPDGKVVSKKSGKWPMAVGETESLNFVQSLGIKLAPGNYQLKIAASDWTTKEVLAENSVGFVVELK